MKRRFYGAALLFLTAGATEALALAKPPPGADPAIHGHAAAASPLVIGVIAIGLIAVAAGIWWLKSNQKD